MTDSVYKANDKIAGLLVRVKELEEWKKQADQELATVWAELEASFNETVGTPRTDETGEKYGGVLFIANGLEIGRRVSDYGSKLDSEKLNEGLIRLVLEGILTQEEKDSMIKSYEKTVVEYSVNVEEVASTATLNPDVAKAVRKATNPPEIRTAKINPRSAKPENITAAKYFDSKVN